MNADRDYMSGPHDGPKCACRHDGLYWQKRCVAAAVNDREESARWAADHIRRSPNTTFTPEYLALAATVSLAAMVAIAVAPTCNEDLR